MITNLPAGAGKRKEGGRTFTVVLGGLFLISGVSGLTYEVVWVRMLTRLLGNTASATSIVLSVFMAGLGLGSLSIGRFTDRLRRPLLCYGLLELGIGGTAVLSLGLPNRLLPFYRGLYGWLGESRASLGAVEIAIAFLALLVPTALMGATFPALCSFGSRRCARFTHYVGALYALNAFGAVSGVLLAGFVTIGAVGETRTVMLGVALNSLVGFGALTLSRVSEGPIHEDAKPHRGAATIAPRQGQSLATPAGNRIVPDHGAVVRRLLLLTTATSGFIALGSQVVWGRMLVLYQGTSIYAFSAMLAVILGGMGIGSLAGGNLAGKRSDPLRLLARLQMGVGFGTAFSLSLFGLGDAMKPDLASGQHLAGMAVAPVLFLGPLGLLWGVIFPVTAHCYVRGQGQGGRSISELYAWNTFGCIAGAAVTGFLLIPTLGVSASVRVLAGSSMLLGLIILLVHPDGLRRTSWAAEGYFLVSWGLLLVSAGDPYRQLLSQQMERRFSGPVTLDRYEETAAGTVAAFGRTDDLRWRQLWIDGEGMTVLVSVTKLMAHLPLWLADDPKDILVICFGMGTTVRSASRHEGLEIWAVDRIPTVFDCFALFHPDDSSLLQRPNIHTIVDDGRNLLLLNLRQYDVITVDPAPPLYSAGTVSLYSREFFQLCSDRLRPHGVMCLWVPEGSASEVKAIMRTFFDVFHEATVWNSPLRESVGGCYLIGACRPIQGVAERIRRGFRDRAVVADLKEWGSECDRPEKVLDLFVADRRRLASRLDDVPVITDDHPYTEFPFWRALSQTVDYSKRLSGESLRRQLATASENLPTLPPESEKIH